MTEKKSEEEEEETENKSDVSIAFWCSHAEVHVILNFFFLAFKISTNAYTFIYENALTTESPNTHMVWQGHSKNTFEFIVILRSRISDEKSMGEKKGKIRKIPIGLRQYQSQK